MVFEKGPISYEETGLKILLFKEAGYLFLYRFLKQHLCGGVLQIKISILVVIWFSPLIQLGFFVPSVEGTI